MLFQRYEPLSDTPPGYRQHLATGWRHNALLMLLGASAVGIASWTDVPRLQYFAVIMCGMGLTHLVVGGAVILSRSLRSGGGNPPG